MATFSSSCEWKKKNKFLIRNQSANYVFKFTHGILFHCFQRYDVISFLIIYDAIVKFAAFRIRFQSMAQRNTHTQPGRWCLPTVYQQQWTNIGWALILLRKWRKSTSHRCSVLLTGLHKQMVLIWIDPLRIWADRYCDWFYEIAGPYMNQAVRQSPQITWPLFRICMIH